MQFGGAKGWECHLYRALKKDGTSLWPDMWPTAVLEQRRKEMGEYAFEQEYMNNPIPDDKRTFKKEWIRYFEKEPQGCVYFTTVDPAFTDTSKSDYTAIVTVAVDSLENIYVVDVINARLMPNELINAVFDVFKRYGSSRIGIETVAAQKLLKYNLEEEKKRRKVYPIFEELNHGGRRKNLRIEALQPKFQRGAIYIRDTHKELEQQLVSFPSTRGHDDIIDALAYHLDIIRPGMAEKVRAPANSFLEAWTDVKQAAKRNKRSYWGAHKRVRL
jgi:predicted phage terminase large subunit-like protein